MCGLSLCDLCLCYSIFGSQFSNKYLLTYLLVGRGTCSTLIWPTASNLEKLNLLTHCVLRPTQPPVSSAGWEMTSSLPGMDYRVKA